MKHLKILIALFLMAASCKEPATYTSIDGKSFSSPDMAIKHNNHWFDIKKGDLELAVLKDSITDHEMKLQLLQYEADLKSANAGIELKAKIK